MQKIKTQIPLIFLAFATLWLRLVNLGYSDYQGDEIKALFFPNPGQTGLQFLLEQRKGPIQFLITYFLHFLSPDYLNQFVMRLPFAIAGILSVFFFYKLVKLHFDKKIALYATILMSLNGLFVAFSRIVQYQSFTILFSILALYLFSLTLKETRWQIKGWYVGMIFWALSILAHFDGGFIAPFALYILVRWFRESSLDQKTKVKHILLSGLTLGALLAIFFVPYILNISLDTTAYWQTRLSGGAEKISSSRITFRIYNPTYMLYIFTGLVTVSLIKLKKTWPVLVWAALPFLIFEVVTNIPGTHIYNYILPATILAAFGITICEDLMKKVFSPKFGSVLNTIGLSVLFVFMFLLAHAVFVNNTTEYPWEDEKFLVWTITKPSPAFHLSLFGFPYNRQWETLAYVINASDAPYYSTNERDNISKFYIHKLKDTDSAGYYILVENPQNLAPDAGGEKIVYWSSLHEPVMLIMRGQKTLARLYLMPTGPLETLREYY